MDSLEKQKANQEAAKAIIKDQAINAEEKEFNSQVKQDMQDAWLKSQAPYSGLTTFDWIWDLLIHGFKKRNGLGKVIYIIIWIGALYVLFWGLSKLFSTS